ncbi:MAG: hypothetical protein H6739_07050 [Alphaproteobacteria bacterium]|nr:hypothetical protein [Alphaproteobacteria bacterium]
MLLLIALLACKADEDSSTLDTSIKTTDTAPTGWDLPLSVTALSVACDGADWVWTVTTAGWAGGAALTIYGPPSDEGGFEWSEAHPFPVRPDDYDPDGAWEVRSLTLTPAGSAEAVVPGSSTQLACSEAELAVPTWLLVLSDRTGVEATCVTGGADPTALGLDCESAPAR